MVYRCYLRLNITHFGCKGVKNSQLLNTRQTAFVNYHKYNHIDFYLNDCVVPHVMFYNNIYCQVILLKNTIFTLCIKG